MTANDPREALRTVQAELNEVSVRLSYLAQEVRAVSAALPLSPVAPGASPAATLQPTGVGNAVPATPGPAQPPPASIARSASPADDRPGTTTEPPPPGPLPNLPERRRGRRISVPDLFAVAGSAITLIGVTFVLVLPQDGVLGPLSRVGIAVALAVAAVAAAIWQHAEDDRNVGAQALLATGVASAYLCVLAGTVLFVRPDGRGLVPDAVGLALAGLISVGGLWTARRWNSQWLGVLAVLGCLVLAPFVVDQELIWGLGFMILLTIVTAPFQLGRTWVALMAARVKPTTLVFFAAVMLGQPSLVENPTVTLVLAAVLAVAGLGMAVLHEPDNRPNQLGSAVAIVPMVAPAAAACWLADRPAAAVAGGVLAVLYGACGLLPARFSPVLRSVAVPVGALFAGFALLRLTDGGYAGSITFGLAVAYLALAARSRFRPAFLVGLVTAGLGSLGWIWLLVAALFLGEATDHGTEAVAESLLGLAAMVLAGAAMRTFGVPGSWRMAVTWLASAAFGSTAVVLLGTEIGQLLDRPAIGFQAAHVLVTVSWLVLCVLLLRSGLQSGDDGPVAVRLALVLAVAAVAKLFLFDLATLPDLVRALAFMAVGVLLLVIGTWYFRQLDRVRRATTPDSAPVYPGAPPVRAAEPREVQESTTR